MLRPSDESSALYSFTATLCPFQSALYTTPEVPSPTLSPRDKSAYATCCSEPRGGAGTKHGLPATASQVRRGIACSHSGRRRSRLLARRSSSSSRIAAMLRGSAPSRLLESISLRISTSSPIWCGSSASRLSVRMSHSSDTGSGTCTERSAQLLKESMRSCGSCEIAGGTSSKPLARRNSTSREGGSAGSPCSALKPRSSFFSRLNSAMATGSVLILHRLRSSASVLAGS
mmetsp:Transcript_10339/g.24631  ORF Transcript_10339/g.24631 Transcript_10339/m.24631 type:complete len:230 (-) Transcript_10339:143-832(-)